MFPGFRGGGRGGFPPPFQGGRFPMMNNMNGMGFQAFGQFNNRPGMQNFMPDNMQNNFMPNMGRGGRGGMGMGRGVRGGMMGPGRMGPGPSPATPNRGTSTFDKTTPVADKTPVVDNSSPAVNKSKPIVEKTSEVNTSTVSTPTTATSVVKTEVHKRYNKKNKLHASLFFPVMYLNCKFGKNFLIFQDNDEILIIADLSYI